ncbi:hypothetical protein AMIS_19720 [Actinoplanes missouriensis 431]|uniref:Uncharacterized protein n=1 Tax=Actinoplanes missouriensis (strain ATCC 14538 / DSM 43046 / CBS 188.64 / JCM 3121 / NBRC 102363 / NCIMB 12654 / NRRL B-3342 / UNCC 431) TaxID=512565 RepID=I0H2F5_ACTM4|nr:hypothetical protein [Actinoplanes missouriensis]BAL87192.1 hypothetical protein AMIS_19720 [Actinoplanes missouriensis 431]
MNTKLKAGDSTYMNITDAHGVLLFVVLVQLFTDHVSFTFANHPILNRAMPIGEGRAYLRFLIDEAAKGTPAAIIEDLAGQWTSAAAVADQAEQDMLDDLAADFAQRDADAAADLAAQQTATARSMTKAYGDEWYRLRHPRKVRPTRTRVHVQPPTAAMLDRMRRHRNGVVTCGPGQPWTLLDGLIQRGLADQASAVYRPGTQIIASVRLNARGWAAIGQQSGVAA